MNRLNTIFTLSSLSVVLVTVERFSFTTKIFLQPYNFLSLHELIQMALIILITVIIPFFLLREVTGNFELLKKRSGMLLGLLFVVGIYYYATGNGIHETAGHYFHLNCDVDRISGELCNSYFINDYYTGNILYFIGGFFMIVSLLISEILNPNKNYSKKDLKVTLVNAVVYSLAIFAYAAYDVVSVGLIYSFVTTFFALVLFIRIKKDYLRYPVITYTAVTYVLGSIPALFVRYIF